MIKKLILSYDTDKDDIRFNEERLVRAMKADNAYGALWDIREKLLKLSSDSNSEVEIDTLGRVLEEFHNITFYDHNINLDNEYS